MSDSQDDKFEQLVDQDQSTLPQQHNNSNNNHLSQQNPSKAEKIYQVKIIQSENKIDMNILENQFYLVELYKKGKLFKDNVKRRYSDFDLLFEVLEKKYSGFIFPAFPEKGILSYVKTKVSVTKDELFMKNRIRMIQRFFNSVLNEPKFNLEKCTEIRKFFSIDEEYEIFKKTVRQEINRDKSIVDSTWGIIKDFFKMNQTSKYTAVIEEIKKEKQAFEQLSTKTHQLIDLINDQCEANNQLGQFQDANSKKCSQFIPSFHELRKKVQEYSKLLEPVQHKLRELQLDLYCENQDYLMVLKRIEFIEQMRQSEQNYKNLAGIETEFMQKRIQIQQLKKFALEEFRKKFKTYVNQVNQIQRSKE